MPHSPYKGSTKEVPIAEIHPEFYHFDKRLRSQKTAPPEPIDQDIITLEDRCQLVTKKSLSSTDEQAST